MGTESEDMKEIKRMFGEISLKLTNMEEKLSKNTEIIERLKTENSE